MSPLNMLCPRALISCCQGTPHSTLAFHQLVASPRAETQGSGDGPSPLIDTNAQLDWLLLLTKYFDYHPGCHLDRHGFAGHDLLVIISGDQRLAAPGL